MEVDKDNANETKTVDSGTDLEAPKAARSINPINVKSGNNRGTNKKIRTLVPTLQMAGHTGYLTFATWPPQPHASSTKPAEQIVKEEFPGGRDSTAADESIQC